MRTARLLTVVGVGCESRRVSRRCTPPPDLEPDTPLWTEWLADRCKNITFPQLRLRAITHEEDHNPTKDKYYKYFQQHYTS